MMSITKDRINKLFDELVPATGKASTVAGEILRAVSRISYRNYNDGDHIGVGYGKETCNPAARYLMARAGKEVSNCVTKAWGIVSDEEYDRELADIEAAVLVHLDEYPELMAEKNTEDMWDFADKYEDVDDWADDEEDEEYGEEEEEEW